MKFYKDLYISEVYKKRRKQIIKDIKNKKMLFHTYLITISDNPTMQLEIIHVALLTQELYETDNLHIVGVTCGYPEALEIVEMITKSVYLERNDVDIKGYLMERKWDD